MVTTLSSVRPPALSGVADIDWRAVQDEAAELLGRLIQLDTSNPPGGESQVAVLLADVLSAEGVEVHLLAATPGRDNLVATLRGSGTKPPLLLLGHTDVVYADPDGWRYPPFSGVTAEGCVWGRGALDMKGLLVMQVLALLWVRRLGLRLDRDIRLLACADEEDTGRFGAGWIVDHYWDRVAAELVFGEGGMGIHLSGRPAFLVATAEKGYADLTLTARGQIGHASMPSPDNALIALAEAIGRIATYRSRVQWSEPVNQHVAALAHTLPWQQRAQIRLMRWPELAERLVEHAPLPTLRHSLRNTFTPTMAQAGRQANVVPDLAEATLNCRTLPGVSQANLLAEVRSVLGTLPVEVAVRQFSPGNVSPADTPFFDALAASIHAEIPDALIAPYIMPGATDARFFRSKGVTAYGLMPVCLTQEEMASIHGVDERIRLESLEQGTRAIFRLLISV